jgi:hypothetical protein
MEISDLEFALGIISEGVDKNASPIGNELDIFSQRAFNAPFGIVSQVESTIGDTSGIIGDDDNTAREFSPINESDDPVSSAFDVGHIIGKKVLTTLSHFSHFVNLL